MSNPMLFSFVSIPILFSLLWLNHECGANWASQLIISPLPVCVVCVPISNTVSTSPERILLRQTMICDLCALRHAEYFEMSVIGRSFGFSKGHFSFGNVFLCTFHILRRCC